MFIYDDNFLTEEEIIEIEKMFWSQEITWRYWEHTQNNDVNHVGVVNTGVADVPYFSFSMKETQDSYQCEISKKIIETFCKKHNINYRSISRIKFNITPSVKNAQTLYPHVDRASRHLVFLYYVNDSDGETFLYNETFNNTKFEPPLTIMQKVKPKRGAAFIVDGSHFHSITPPEETSLRGVINANLHFEII
jgi:hypothetical protein